MAMVTVLFGGDTVSSHTIKHHPYIVGRDANADIQIDNIGISRQHCQFVWDQRHFSVQDMESANGVVVHGQKVRMSPVKDGDEIKLGKYTLIFHQASGEGPPPAKGSAEGGDKKGFADSMKTFQVDARVIHEQAAAEPRRAGDMNKAMASASSGGGKGLVIALAVMGALVVGLGVAVLLLLTRGEG